MYGVEEFCTGNGSSHGHNLAVTVLLFNVDSASNTTTTHVTQSQTISSAVILMQSGEEESGDRILGTRWPSYSGLCTQKRVGGATWNWEFKISWRKAAPLKSSR